MEILDTLGTAPDLVILPVVGGCLSAGVTKLLRQIAPRTQYRFIEPAGGASLAAALADELDALTPDQRAYKGLVSVGPELVAKLRALQSSVATDRVRPEK